MDVASGDERGTTERVLTLLGLLQQRQVWTGPELADRLGVTPRTVRRDVERLRTLGYPVHAGQGVGGGYQLGAGQDLPPLLLDDEEAIATAVSLLAGAVARSPAPVTPHFGRCPSSTGCCPAGCGTRCARSPARWSPSAEAARRSTPRCS
jgi:biotin operon repressor